MEKATNITWHGGEVSRADRERLLGQRGGVVDDGVVGEREEHDRGDGGEDANCAGELAYRLDGDNVRHGLNSNLGFGAEDRAENIRRIGEVAKLFVDAGVIAIASFISPYVRDRNAVRANMGAGDFLEVYIKASVAAAERRDPKGLYKKARAGEIKGFTGIDDPYEEPELPDLVIDTETMTAEEAAREIVRYLEMGGYLQA